MRAASFCMVYMSITTVNIDRVFMRASERLQKTPTHDGMH